MHIPLKYVYGEGAIILDSDFDGGSCYHCIRNTRYSQVAIFNLFLRYGEWKKVLLCYWQGGKFSHAGRFSWGLLGKILVKAFL